MITFEYLFNAKDRRHPSTVSQWAHWDLTRDPSTGHARLLPQLARFVFFHDAAPKPNYECVLQRANGTAS